MQMGLFVGVLVLIAIGSVYSKEVITHEQLLQQLQKTTLETKVTLQRIAAEIAADNEEANKKIKSTLARFKEMNREMMQFPQYCLPIAPIYETVGFAVEMYYRFENAKGLLPPGTFDLDRVDSDPELQKAIAETIRKKPELTEFVGDYIFEELKRVGLIGLNETRCPLPIERYEMYQ